MGNFDEEDRLYAAYNDRLFNQGTSATGIGSILLAAAAGLYCLYKALELLGFPVWLWVHMALERIGMLWDQGATSTDTGKEGEETQDSMMQRGGNMLGSVFGLNTSSILQKGVRGVTGALAKGPSDVPPGLGNWDNSCFQNSVIQGLASLPALRDYLSNTTGQFRSLDADTTNGALFELISKLNDPDNHGKNFWVSGRLKSMSTFQQQDAQEYYSKILDALDKEVQGASNVRRRSSASWLDAAMSLEDSATETSDAEEGVATQGEAEDAKPSSAKPKAAPNPLDGLLAQRVGCINCGYSEGLQLIPFNCVTVSLGRGYTYDIRDCLDEYTQLENIEGVECAKCTLLKLKGTLAPLVANGAPFGPRLQAVEGALEDDDFDDKTLVKKFNILKKNWVQSTKSKQAVIARAPKALVLHVNRSIFDEMTGAQYKNTAAVAYPRLLDLGNWCLGSRPSESHLPDNEEEEWPRDPTKSMIGDTHVMPSTPSPFQYQLRAAVTHFGTHGNGHYVCYRPHAKRPDTSPESQGEEQQVGSEQWWRFSDDSVYAVSEAQAHQGNVFMLFYERVDPSMPVLFGDRETSHATLSVTEDVPLPPADLSASLTETLDETALNIPLPEDDEDDNDSLPDLVSNLDFPTPPATASQPSTPQQRPLSPEDSKPSDLDIFAYPSPPPDSSKEYSEQSEGESTDASTDFSSTDQAPPAPAIPRSKYSPSPHLMRTAGQSPSGGEGRRSLPMVTAT